MTAPIPLADLRPGVLFSLRAAMDPDDPHAKVCEARRVRRWNGDLYVWFRRPPGACEPGTVLLEKARADDAYPVTDTQYREWLNTVRRWQSAVQAVPRQLAEPWGAARARRDLAHAIAATDACLTVYRAWVDRQPVAPGIDPLPTPEPWGQLDLFGGDAA